jgi:hypothetical protein
MRTCPHLLAVSIVLVIPAVTPAGESWYRSPGLAVMTGYIYEPKSPYTIREWEKGLGDKMDADRWVADFREAGAGYLIFYDKWIDGFVFHDTRTTKFKTRRDFVREVADACHRGGLPLVYYYNAISDGNPEFDEWSLLDRQGEPIAFSRRWPTRYQTLHSPFRKVSVEQLRELLTGYGEVDGIWLDIFRERLDTSSEWVARGYQTMYGEPFDRASPDRLAEFNARTLAGYLDEVRPIAREHQPGCVWTANGSARNLPGSGVWSKWVGPRLDYLSVEGHRFERMDQLARRAWVSPKPTETGLLLCSSWFTPMEEAAPPASMTEKQAIAAAAVALCQGATVYMALTPGHSGVFGEDLQRAKAIGAWFQAAERVLRGARPYADVGIVLGSPAIEGPGLPAGNVLWKWYEAEQRTAWDEAIALNDALGRAGVFGQVLYDSQQGGSWPESLAGCRAILLPERVMLDDAHADGLRQYVEQGGKLVAFGHASMLDAHGERQDDYLLGDVLGAKYEEEVVFPPELRKTRVRTDSEYSPQFAAANLLDGRPTAWASAGTPMPHWAEITLPEPDDVARVELVSRQGPYLVADVDVEAPDGSDWKPVGSVRGADNRAISVSLKPPVRTSRIRVNIRRELYQGEDRQHADVEAIRVVDTAGRDVSTNRAASIRVLPAAPDVQEALAGASVAVPPMAVRVEPTGAEVIARLDDPHGSPAMLRNRYGQGEAILVTTSEASFAPESPFWAALRRLTIGKPTLTCDAQALERYRLVLTRVVVGTRRVPSTSRETHVLHAIDRTAGSADWQAAEVRVSLEPARLGGIESATLVGSDALLPTARENGRVTFTLRPDPVASVVLR